MREKKILYIVNVDWFFVSHRLPIAVAAKGKGYDIHIATKLTSEKCVLESYGLTVHSLKMDRSGWTPLQLIASFFEIFKLLRIIKPDLVHLVTIKPILIGGIAARFFRQCSVVASISGLGSMMIMRGALGGIIRNIIGLLYRCALAKTSTKVIFQNEDDKLKIVDIAKLPASKVVLVAGSGVDLSIFRPKKKKPTRFRSVVLASRMLRDKGVVEFIEAVRWLRTNFPEVTDSVSFILVGDPDPDNPTSLSPLDLHAWVTEGLVEHRGYRADMPEVFADAYMVVLPSYREGFPKVLMEAAACGRAVITTDVAGCRDAIDRDRSGILVPPRDSKALAIAIKSLLDDPLRCEAMGRAGRDLAERAFDVKQVTSAHVRIYQELISAETA